MNTSTLIINHHQFISTTFICIAFGVSTEWWELLFFDYFFGGRAQSLPLLDYAWLIILFQINEHPQLKATEVGRRRVGRRGQPAGIGWQGAGLGPVCRSYFLREMLQWTIPSWLHRSGCKMTSWSQTVNCNRVWVVNCDEPWGVTICTTCFIQTGHSGSVNHVCDAHTHTYIDI